MASWTLVGSLGTVAVSSANGSAISPTYGTSETHASGHLGICWGTLPTGTITISAGWTQAGNRNSTYIWWRLLDGTATDLPTLTPSAGKADGRLGEWTPTGGYFPANPVDQTGSASGTTSSLTATAAATDAASGELVIIANAMQLGTAGTTTTTISGLNNGMTYLGGANNDATSVQNHYNLGYAVTTGKSAADAETFAWTGTASTNPATVLLVSFLNPTASNRPNAVYTQAVNRSSYW